MRSSDVVTAEAETKGGPCGAVMRRYDASMIAWSLVVAATMIASSVLIRTCEMPVVVKLLTALTPVVPFVFVLLMMVRAARHLDEMWSRVQAEALAGTVILTAIGSFVWGQLQKAGFVEAADVSLLWPVMALLYGACFALARRRYA